MDVADVQKSIDGLIAELDRALGDHFSAAAYGSVVRGDWVAGRSDVNVLIVLDDASPAALAALTPAVAAWHKRGLTPPLFIGRDEWSCAADVFPVEITDMQLAYTVLHGADPVGGVRVAPADLRRAIEAELRGKLVRLRQAYVRFGDAMPALGGFATTSVPSFLVLLRSTAVLMGRDPGRTPQATADGLADLLGPDAGVVAEIASHRREKEWKCPPGAFARYLDVVRRAVDAVDTHNQHGAR